MITRAMIDEFLGEKNLALAGVSRSGKRFGHAIRKELTSKGYQLRLIHPEADAIDQQPCARSLAEVAGEVGGVVLVTRPAATSELVRQAAEAGIRRIWMQQGSESEEAIRFCEDHQLLAIHHQCILMFAEPCRFPHSTHRWFRKVFGKQPV